MKYISLKKSRGTIQNRLDNIPKTHLIINNKIKPYRYKLNCHSYHYHHLLNKLKLRDNHHRLNQLSVHHLQYDIMNFFAIYNS